MRRPPPAGGVFVCIPRFRGNECANGAWIAPGAVAQGSLGNCNYERIYAAFCSICGRGAGADRDFARLQLFRNFANQFDLQQAVGQRGILHLHVIGKLEAALEGAASNAAIQKRAVGGVVVVALLLALDDQRVFVRDQFSSSSEKPATASVMRYAFSAVFSML